MALFVWWNVLYRKEFEEATKHSQILSDIAKELKCSNDEVPTKIAALVKKRDEMAEQVAKKRGITKEVFLAELEE